MSSWYILVDGKPVLEPDLHKASEFRENHQVTARHEYNGITVSTVFLGLDHQYGDGPPILWETMVFHVDTAFHDYECERYSSYDDALMGHIKMCNKVFTKEYGEWILAEIDRDRAEQARREALLEEDA